MILWNSTLWANPVIRNVLKRGAGFYAVIRVAYFRIIDPTANITNVFFHWPISLCYWQVSQPKRILRKACSGKSALLRMKRKMTESFSQGKQENEVKIKPRDSESRGFIKISRQRATLPWTAPQYHRRKGPSRSCSEWERVLPPRHGHRK